MENRYKKSERKNVSVYIWSAVVILLVAGAAGAGTWLGVYAAQQTAETEPEPAEEAGGNPVTADTEQIRPESPEEEPGTEQPSIEEPVAEQPIIKEPQIEEPIDRTVYPETIEPPEEPTVIQGIILANKQYPLPADFAPGENAEARAAFERMAAAAEQEGIQLVAFSTYRSFDRQEELYKGYVAKDGEEAADRYSARPGHSEHQTGLAFDIGELNKEEQWASTTFGETAGGRWLADNAHEYGFILRYPEGKEKTTGYMYESWHFRYVGNKAADVIHEQGITLEEYLNVQR